MGVAPGSQGTDASDVMGEWDMKDARLDRPRTGDSAKGDARPEVELAPNHSTTPEVVPTRDWTRTTRGRSDTSMLVHWVDEKGSIVRLLTSTNPDAQGTDA